MEKSKNTQKGQVWIRQTLTGRSKFPSFSPTSMLSCWHFSLASTLGKWGQKEAVMFTFFDWATD